MAIYRLSAFADEAATDLPGQIRALKRNGISFVELRGLESGPIDLQSDGTVKEAARALSAEGIGISAIGSRLGKTKLTQPFARSLESLKRLCEICHPLDANRIRMFSYYIPEGEKPENYRDEVLDRVAKLVDYAKGQGVTLFHENESRIFGELPQDVLTLHEAIPGLGGVYDPSNYRMADADLDFAMDKVMPHIGYLHIKDCTDSHEIVPAGEGAGRLEEMILRHNELFEGESFLTVEPHLTAFSGYGDIDTHQLKNRRTFKDNNESFDFAVKTLKGLLTKAGFSEGEEGWEK